LRAGFSLVEVLVVISLFTVLMSIALPAMNRARESGREAQCKSNLRQLGLGLIQYADSHSTVSSGAWDWKLDGCISEVGWVADLVPMGILPSQLNCPSSNVQLHEQYQTMLDFDPTTNQCANSLGTPIRPSTRSPGINVCRELSAVSSPSDRTEILATLLEDGYNSNYVATWLMTRSDPRIDSSGALMGGTAQCPPSLDSRNSTVGPVNKARIGSSAISSTIVPMLACAQMGDYSKAILSHDVGPFGAGSRLSKGMTDGPLDPNTSRPPVMGTGTGMDSWWPYWSRTIQDYRAFGAVHGGRACNVLFLDGSVGTFTDTNSDGLLNNGFRASSTNQFIDDTIELPRARIYSGWTLNPSRIPRR